MFNLEDKDLIKRIIDQRDKGAILIPVCVKIDQFYWNILEFDKYEITGSNIKIVFGTSNNVFIHNKFPKNTLINFDNVRIFKSFDDDTQVSTEYIIFEASDYDGTDITDPKLISVYKEINNWYDIVGPYVEDILNRNRKEVIMRMMEENS